jgi:hypothetical protein
MVKLPKNCKVNYFNDGVYVKATYATSLPTGVHDGVTVFANWQGRRYFSLEFNVKYQNNMPTIVMEKYYQYKKKAMLFNRMKKQEQLQKEIDVLSNSIIPGTWDLHILKNNNQLPPPPDEISLDDLPY